MDLLLSWPCSQAQSFSKIEAQADHIDIAIGRWDMGGENIIEWWADNGHQTQGGYMEDDSHEHWVGSEYGGYITNFEDSRVKKVVLSN